MRAAAQWAGASTASLALHALAIAAMIVAFRPDPVSDPSVPEQTLEVVTADVRSERAGALPIPADPASTAAPAAVRLSGGSIPATAGTAIRPSARPLVAATTAGSGLAAAVPPSTPAKAVVAGPPAPALPADPRRLTAWQPTGLPAAPVSATGASVGVPVRPDAPVLSPVRPGAPAAGPVPPEGATAASVRIDATPVGPVAPDGAAVAPASVDATPMGPVALDGAAVAPTRADATPVRPLGVDGPRMAEAIPPSAAMTRLSAAGAAVAPGESGGSVLSPAIPAGTPARAPPLPATASVAALAWTGTAALVDPLSVAAVGAFVDPRADVAGLRDRVAATLGAVDCARVQTAFDPETGALEMRGHVPEAALGGRIAAALRAEIGPDIPIVDRLQVLPRPLCGLLSSLDAVGLPQSDDQVLDPRFIGEGAQVRTWAFTGGDRLVLDIRSPDYPATLYVDYFDATGSVLHLQPNEIVAAERLPPDTPLLIGASSGDRPSLDLTIAPPFGQEIVVAFASSHPLYPGLRPLTEPAGPYLGFLGGAVAEARATYPDFKGEWAYFLVSTAERR